MIENIEQYNELAELADAGYDRIYNGTGESGTHYYIMHILQSKYKIPTNSREEAIKVAYRLCNEYLDKLNYEALAETE